MYEWKFLIWNYVHSSVSNFSINISEVKLLPMDYQTQTPAQSMLYV